MDKLHHGPEKDGDFLSALNLYFLNKDVNKVDRVI